MALLFLFTMCIFHELLYTFFPSALKKGVWGLSQGKVREFCGWSGKFKKDLESQGKVREFENR